MILQQKHLVAFAILAGYTNVKSVCFELYGDSNEHGRHRLPNFFNDHAAVLKVIENLTQDQRFDLAYEIHDILGLVPKGSPALIWETMVVAYATITTEQLIIATLKATKNWED